jgi:acyl-CoA thioesterase FadM
MSNDAVPRLCHEGRLQLFNHFGVTELHLGQAGVGIIMGDLVANFLAEGHLHDTLLVETHPEELSRSSVRVCHRLSRDGETIALAETGLICFNYHTKKVVAWPEAVREGLAELSH